MEKIYKILVVFALLMLVITYSIRARERRFREYFFSRRLPLPFPAAPEPDLLSVRVAGQEEYPQAEDPENELTFSGGPGAERLLSVADQRTGDPVAEIALDESSDALIFDPATRLIYSYSVAGALTIIRQSGRNSYKIMQRMLIPREGHALALDPQKSRIYLSAGGYVFVYVNE